MATIKIKFRPSTVAGKEGTLCYQVIHQRQIAQLSTGYKLFCSEWDKAAGRIKRSKNEKPDRSFYLDALEIRLEKDMRRLVSIIEKLNRLGKLTSAQVISDFRVEGTLAFSFFTYARKLITRTRNLGRERTSEIYASSLNSFIRFRGEAGDLALEEIDSALIMDYEAYLKRNGKCMNTVSFYMRSLRALYNRASEEGLVENCYPFRRVNTNVGKTVKRAVSAEVVGKIKSLNLEGKPALGFARDLFLLSFYLRGMSFVDLAFLKKRDLQNGLLVYRRHKTGQQFCIKWEKPMQDIIKKYSFPDTPYLLPLIRKPGVCERRQYLNAFHVMNKRLQQIGKMIDCPVKLTFYVARHGWASIAQSQQVPLPIISEALGHNSEMTTRIYLSLLDASALDKANGKVIRSIEGY